jgi:putative hemolysin
VTEDDVHTVLLEGERSGAVESEERKMAEGVFYLGERPVGAFMTHRSEVVWLAADCSEAEAKQTAVEFMEQRYFPVARETLDEIRGGVSVEDILLALLENRWAGVESVMKKARFIPETMAALKAFEAFKRHNDNYLCVMDEYGGFAGILTLRDLLEVITGVLSAPEAGEEAIVKEAGGWLADGAVNIDELAASIGLSLPEGAKGDYHTLAGFILAMAEEIPKTGDAFDAGGYSFKICAMDGNRIDRVRVVVI